MKRVVLFVLLSLPLMTYAQKFTEYDRKVFNEGQVLDESDVQFASDEIPWSPISPIKLYHIHDEGDETIVTFSHSIYFDSQWVNFSKSIYVKDDDTGDIYKVRGYTDGLTMDRLLIVNGCKGKNILVSLRFPKFKRKVKKISIYSPGHKDDIKPSNDRDIKVFAENADVKKMRKLYKLPKVYK